MRSTRGQFVRNGTAAVAALALGGRWLGGPGVARAAVGPYGDLLAADANGLALPAGFTSRLIAATGQPVGDTNYIWHAFPDGCGTFASAGGGWVLASNSEDNGTQGGASAIRFDRNGSIVDAYRILGGTKWNCAGGVTPWGSWLSCEEFRQGFVWECYPLEKGKPAVARPGLGTFIHEAAPVDPLRGHVYLTEDSYDSRLYRFAPNRAGDLGAGRLQAAKVATSGAVTWVDVSPTSPYRGKETAVFARGEGAWIFADVLYFTTTGDDRVWALDLRRQVLSVIYDGVVQGGPLNSPDNITVHARTGDLFVAEDGADLQLVQFRRQSGGVWSATPFLQLVGHDGSEVTGPVFSPDGRKLYVTSQRGMDGKTGLTYEINGPF